MLRQEHGYGCGLYAVANALSLPEFVTPERLEASIDGNRFMQLNRWLLDDKKDFQIVPIYFQNEVQFKTPKMKMNCDACPNMEYYPILITIGIKNCPKNHMIAIQYNADQSVFVLDSCEVKPLFFLSWDSFRLKYPRIISMEVFKNFEDKEIYIQK